MNGFEFVLILLGMVIVGLWGLIILAYKCGLYENKNNNKK